MPQADIAILRRIPDLLASGGECFTPACQWPGAVGI